MNGNKYEKIWVNDYIEYFLQWESESMHLFISIVGSEGKPYTEIINSYENIIAALLFFRKMHETKGKLA